MKLKLRQILVLSLPAVLAVILILGYYIVYQPLRNIKNATSAASTSALKIADGLKNDKVEDLDVNLANIQTQLTIINLNISKFSFLNDIEFTKGYYKNLNVGNEIVADVNELIGTISPDLKSILSKDVTSTKPEDKEKINIFLMKLPEYLKLYDKIEPNLIKILTKLKNIDANYIPVVPGFDIKDKVIVAQQFSDEFPAISTKTKSFLKYIPDLIGSNKKVTYMILLQSTSEMRSSGGLITAVGHLDVQNGKLGDIQLADTWNLERYLRYDLGISTGPVDPKYYKEDRDYVNPLYGFYQNMHAQLHLMSGENYITSWQCGGLELRAQDTGIYPDQYAVMNIAKDYYDNATVYDPETYPEYDFVLTLNDAFAASILKLVQPLTIEGYGEVTAENLFDFIKAETDSAENAGNPNKKDIIKDIANGIKEKFFELPLSKTPEILQVFINGLKSKELAMMTPKNTELQTFFDTYGMSGRTVNNFNGDYFQLGEGQNCSLKLNKWVRDSVTNTIDIAENGSIKRSVKVNWTQAQIYNESLKFQYDSTTALIYRAWVRVYAPKEVENFVSDGYKKSGYLLWEPEEYYDSTMDKAVSDNIIAFDHRRFSEADPVRGTELNVSYKLPSDINYTKDGSYKLLIQKHPGKAWNEPNTIIVNYKGNSYSIQVDLDRDKVVTFKDGILTVENYDQTMDWILELSNKVPWEKLGND